MPRYIFDDKSTLVQVMAQCRQAISLYLSGNGDPDLCHDMASLGPNELMYTGRKTGGTQSGQGAAYNPFH